MVRAYREVADFARTNKVDLRVAAYALALQRIEAVYKEREIFP
jgi:glutamate dehydrogenase (NAD(P)+)